MGSARIETAIDLARLDLDAAIRCGRCGHTRTLKAEAIGVLLGLSTRLDQGRKRLRCSRCGARGARIAPVPRLE